MVFTFQPYNMKERVKSIQCMYSNRKVLGSFSTCNTLFVTYYILGQDPLKLGSNFLSTRIFTIEIIYLYVPNVHQKLYK